MEYKSPMQINNVTQEYVTSERTTTTLKDDVEGQADLLDSFNKIAVKEGIEEAIKQTNNTIQEKEIHIGINYSIKCFLKEGAYAISQAVEEVMGSFDMKVGGASSAPPQLINVVLPDGTDIKVPWGRIILPGFDSESYIDLSYDWDDVEIDIDVRVKKRYEADINTIIKRTKEILAKKSLYMGQAIELEFDNSDNADEPEFMDLTTIDENKILFSSEVKDGLIPILARIKQTDRCRKQGLDIKLGVVMEGPYGTGKTLTAFWLGKIAREFGWTFIYLKNCKHSAKALKIVENYARNGNGVILFTEDIDQVVKGERDSAIQEIVNILDGGDTKNLPIISIFTTNHLEVIDATFLRGKRIGSLIHFGELDKETATQFIEKLVVDDKGKSLLTKGPHPKAIEALCGIVPAFASEVIDKAKAYMINRNANKISSDDIVTAAESYKKQIKHAQCRAIEDVSDVETALKIVMQAAGVTGQDEHQQTTKTLGKIRNAL